MMPYRAMMFSWAPLLVMGPGTVYDNAIIREHWIRNEGKICTNWNMLQQQY